MKGGERMTGKRAGLKKRARQLTQSENSKKERIRGWD